MTTAIPTAAAPPDGERIGRLAFAVLLSVLAVRVVLLPVLAWNSRYVMDEYGQAGAPNYISMGFYHGLDPVKTVLYVYVFQIAHRVADDAVRLLHVARLEGAALAFLAAAVTYGVSRRLGRSRFERWLSVGVLFSFTNFMERSFRIRSDTVAVAFATCATFAAVGGEGPLAACLAGILAGGAFLSTQKAVYPLVALGFGVVLSGLGVLPLRRQLARIAAYAGGVAAALLAYGTWFDAANPIRVLSMVILSPFRYAPLHANPHYVGIRGLYVVQTLVRNPFSYALCAAGLVLVLLRFRTASPRLRLVAVAAATVTFLVFRHDQPWPYVFVMALPFLAAFAPDALLWAEARARRRAPWVRLAVCGLLLAQLPRNFAYLGHDNWVQNEVVRYAESQLASGDRYFDGVGMIPTRQLADPVSWEALILAGVKSELAHGDGRSIQRILEGKPKLWILNYRIHELREYLPRLLDPSYVRVHPDVLLAGTFLGDRRPTLFVNRWPGRFRLFRPDGSPSDERWTLDGRDAGAESFVSDGPHDVAVAADGPRYLLPFGTKPAAPLPVTAPLDDFFAGVYD